MDAITAVHTQLQIVSAVGIPTPARALEARRSLLDMGYTCGAPRSYETAEGTRYRVDGTRMDSGEVLL